MIAKLSLAGKLALRELRGGLSGFYVLVACIMLGVTAITTVGVLSTAMKTGLGEQGRVLLGGDLSFALVHTEPTIKQRDFIASFGAISQIATLRSMARKEGPKAAGSPTLDRAVLVDIKAVDKAYPLTGEVQVHGGPFDQTLLQGDKAFVDKLLLERLSVTIGDFFMLGDAKITVAGTIALEPDRLSGRLNFGPRVLISRQTLLRTGLVQPGSLIRYSVRLALKDRTSKIAQVQDVKNQVIEKFPQAGFIVLDRANPTPGISRAINRFTKFLELISLAALFIGGVGVANAVNSHINCKREVIATFKSLGASGQVIFLIYLLQILMLAGVGIGLGLLVGVALPPLLNMFIASMLPVKLHFGMPFSSLMLSTLYGFLVALIFMLWPLGEARKIRAAQLYRSQITSSKKGPGWAVIGLILALVAGLGALIVTLSNMRLVSAFVCLGFLVLYFAFKAIAALLKRGFAAMPRPKNARLAMVRASLAGPTPLLTTTMLSLGIGLSLLTTVSLVQNSMVAELQGGLPKDAPNFFVLDIDKSALQRFKKIASSAAPGIKINDAPMLRGRLTTLAGVPAEKIKPSPGTGWVLRGDRGLTFAHEIPEGSVVTKGKWWSKTYAGSPLVSFEEGTAKGLGLKLGDEVIVNVLGRDIKAKIANLRRVDWKNLSLNFVMIFSPNTLQNAPYKILATLSLQDKDNVEQEGRLIHDLIKALPDITPIAVREVLASIDRVLQGILVAVKAANLVLLLVGAVALAGAMAATHNARLRETVIFKVLGATRARILSVHFMEYLVLALLSTLIALLLGGLAAHAIVTYAMELPYAFSWWVLVEILGLVLALILPLGLLGTWRILGQKSTAHLREA